MPSWPSTLPDKPLREDFREIARSGVIRTQMEVGPAQTRRRTPRPRRYEATFLLSSKHPEHGDQVQDFVDFIDGDIAGGALSFDFEDPRTGDLASFRIVVDEDEPAYELENVGGAHWRAALTLERLPS